MASGKKSKTLIVIVGPTASGKTALAINIARHFCAAVVSADSRQFYREMTIGTAKPTPDELRHVPHHFINSHSIIEDYDAAAFGRDALEKIETLFQEKDYVVLCGGSGLYIRAVLDGFDDIPAISTAVREEINAAYEEYGLSWLQERMAEEDPDHYTKIDRNNPHRLIRALEVKRGTGFSIGHFQTGESKRLHDFCVVKIGLALPRDLLYERIDSRMDAMIAAGLFEEAKALYPFREHQALQTVGYKEIFGFIDGEYDREEAIRLLKRNSRRYAKRQLTWFRRDAEIIWFEIPDEETIIAHISKRCP